MRSVIRRDVVPRIKRFKYPIRAFAGVDAYSKEDDLPLSFCRYGYNISISNGVLSNGPGFVRARISGDELPDAAAVGSRIVNGAVYYRFDGALNARDDRFLFLMKNRKLYSFKPGENEYVFSGITFGSAEVGFLNYRSGNSDFMLIACDDGQAFVYDGTNYNAVTGAPRMNCIKFYNGRGYGTVSAGENKLVYSKLSDLTDWTEAPDAGGSVVFPDEGGKLTGILPFKGNLYVFREYGIYRFTGFGDPTDYSLTKIYASAEKIYFATAAVCNNFMVFASEKGFYKTDGYGFSRVLRGVDPFVESKKHAAGCFFGNKYYVALQLKTDDEEVGDEGRETLSNNALVIYDFEFDEISIFRGGGIGNFIPVDIGETNELFAVHDYFYRGFTMGMIRNCGNYYGDVLHKVFVSPMTDFGRIDSDKVLKKIYIETDADITLTVKLDKEYRYSVPGRSSVSTIVVNRRAEKVGFKIETDADRFKIKGLLLEFDFIGRRYV